MQIIVNSDLPHILAAYVCVPSELNTAICADFGLERL